MFKLFKRRKKTAETTTETTTEKTLSESDHYGMGVCFEWAVCDYLTSRGYKLLFHGYRVHGGEVDLIMKKDDVLAFIEVKARLDDEERLKKYGRPAYAVDQRKRSRIIVAAKDYIRTHPYRGRPRLDVVEVYYERWGGFISLRFDHIEAAFTPRR